jgi:16S rRNA (adenine1518-N6/adenine1519-N6)-dimethyltransferase
VPRKPKLGQNVLVDEAASLRIVDSLGDLRDRTVVEIGPGHGALTALLAPRCRHLHCIELDPALVRELAFRFRNDPHVTIHHADILQFNLETLATGTWQPETESTNPADLVPLSSQPLDVLGNLPYYITSDILLHLFRAAREGLVHRAALMMQLEVAERITAAPGSRDYGALSAATQMHAHAFTLFTLPPEAFSPPPAVFSAVVRLDFAPRFAELGVEPVGFNIFLRASFAQKRKTLENNLRAAGYTREQIAAAWPADLAPQVRAEAVSVESMAALYRALVR